jgi:hypothetical protein
MLNCSWALWDSNPGPTYYEVVAGGRQWTTGERNSLANQGLRSEPSGLLLSLGTVQVQSRWMLDRYFVTNERDLTEAVSKLAALRATIPAKPTLVPRQEEA